MFRAGWPIVTTMDKPWYHKIFSFAEETGPRDGGAKADQGDAEAQFGLGLKYGNSVGDSQDFAQAVHWYQKAAQQNHPLAQFNLGVMYGSGQGVPRDDAASVGWIQRAADQGDAGAQFYLGSRFHRASLGDGRTDLAESRIEAYKWLHLAAAQGYKGSEAAFEQVTLTMSRPEVDEGNERAARFAGGKTIAALGGVEGAN